MKLQLISTGSQAGNCYKFKNILIDCGIPYTRLVNKSKGLDLLEDVKLIFISHLHSDHMHWNTTKGVRKYTTAESIKKNYPNIMWVAGSQEVLEVFEELGLRHMELSTEKWMPFTFKGTERSLKLQLVKLYHDVENYGIRFIDEEGKKGIYLTDTGHLEGINFKDYDYIIIEFNHDITLHTELMKVSSYPEKFIRAMKYHLSICKANKALSEFAKNGSEILLCHTSTEDDYQAMNLETQFIYRK